MCFLYAWHARCAVYGRHLSHCGMRHFEAHSWHVSFSRGLFSTPQQPRSCGNCAASETANDLASYKRSTNVHKTVKRQGNVRKQNGRKMKRMVVSGDCSLDPANKILRDWGCNHQTRQCAPSFCHFCFEVFGNWLLGALQSEPKIWHHFSLYALIYQILADFQN